MKIKLLKKTVINPPAKSVKSFNPEKLAELMPLHIRNILYDHSLTELIQDVVVNHQNGWVRLRHSRKPKLKFIPDGYYFKGGVAREQLRAMFYPDSVQLSVRDIDIVRFSGNPDTHDHELSVEYMLKDYEFGRGVEVAVDEADYFSSRDITINEVYCNHEYITASFNAVMDTVANILAPTKHALTVISELGKSGKTRDDTVNGIDYRIAPKLLRFAAERTVISLPFLLKIPEEFTSTPFHVVLQLNRALAHSEAVGNEYVTLISEHRLVPGLPYPPSLEALVRKLVNKVPGGIGFFRNLPPAMLTKFVT